jgi:hypothetical protein
VQGKSGTGGLDMIDDLLELDSQASEKVSDFLVGENIVQVFSFE